jgi:4-amino-4-deoxy-L-arabinose transferase-like glycosyltransferase
MNVMFFSGYLKKIVSLLEIKPVFIVGLIFVIATVFFNSFAGLSDSMLRNWDESRHGVSACEMMMSGNYIVNTYNGENDYWNVKPVFSFWNIVAGYWLFGENLFGLRCISAFSFVLIAIVTFVVLYKTAGRFAALAGTAFFTVSPSHFSHSFRSGDPDAFFILWGFLAAITLYYSNRNRKLLPVTTFCLAMAFLTKSFHAGVFVIPTVIWILFHWRKYGVKYVAISFVAGMMPVAIWAAGRYCADGLTFFDWMLKLDLFGRVAKMEYSENKGVHTFFYFVKMTRELTLIPVLISVTAIFAGFAIYKRKWLSPEIKDLFCISSLFFVSIILLFSLCNAKAPWYIYPAFAMLPLMVGAVVQAWLDAPLRTDNVKDISDGKRLTGDIFQVLILLSVTAWCIGGELKSVRRVFLRTINQDIFSQESDKGKYAGAGIFSVNAEGNFVMPPQSTFLMMRFAKASLRQGGLTEYTRHDDKDTYLLCTFADDDNAAAEAQKFADKYNLTLLHIVDENALYRKFILEIRKE